MFQNFVEAVKGSATGNQTVDKSELSTSYVAAQVYVYIEESRTFDVTVEA